MQDGDGLVGTGEAVRIPVGTGPGRFETASLKLAQIMREMDVEDEVGVFGSGPVAFGSFTFDPEREGSVLVVPSVVYGKRGDRSWVTTVGDVNTDPISHRADADDHDFKIRYAGSSLSELAWLEAVAKAARSVANGDMEKVVLARDVKIWSKTPFDLSVLIRRLSQRFPECFTFCCDRLVGATPELLVRRSGDKVESLVLAGSARRGSSVADDQSLGDALLGSDKDLAEHEPAVRSVVEVLGPLCSDLHAPSSPELLRLQNVQHLASWVRGTLDEQLSALDLVGRLHPTAAVCGLPRTTAMNVIRSGEGLDRARYAGPVGWVDKNGDGEWGIALRCAELGDTRGRLFAGGGIVADSVPEDELEETRLKLRAVMSAMESA
jgi:menaquinone-specific isochorismate synthase